MFEIILDYLRSGFLEEMSNNNLMKLKVETEYFMLSSLLEIIKQRLGVEEQNNCDTKDEVNVIVERKTFKCKPHALQYCNKELIDQNGDFHVRERPGFNEDLMIRVLRKLEDNRVGDIWPPQHRTEWCEDSAAA